MFSLIVLLVMAGEELVMQKIPPPLPVSTVFWVIIFPVIVGDAGRAINSAAGSAKDKTARLLGLANRLNKTYGIDQPAFLEIPA